MVVKRNINKILIVSLIVLLSACGGADERKVKYLEKGKNYFAEKNYEKAKIEFKNVLQIDPKFAEAYYYLGQLEESYNNYEKAVGLYVKTTDLNPDFVDAKVKIARIFTLVGTNEYIDRADELLKEVFAKDPGHLDAGIVEAIILSKKGANDEAAAKLKSIIDKDKNKIAAYSYLSAILVAQAKQDDAIALLNQGIVNNSDNIQLRMALSQLLSEGGKNLVEAEKQLLKIIELRPEWYDYRKLLSSFYMANGQNDKAEKVLRQAIADVDDEATRYLNLIEFLAKTKSVKSAENELIQFINQKQELSELKFALSEFYNRFKAYDKSTQVLSEIIKQDGIKPDGLRARIKLSQIYLAQSQITNANSLIEEVLSENPNDIDALFEKSKISILMQDYPTAINALRTVIKNEPKNSEASLLLAQTHSRSNEHELAKAVLEKALESDPLNPKNHLNYANYLASRNQLDKGFSIIDRALAYFKTDYDLMLGKLRFLFAKNDDAGVLRHLDQMKKVFPSNHDVYMKRGQYYATKKQFSNALEEFKQASKNASLLFDPLDAVVRTHLVLGQHGQAINEMESRLKSNPNDPYANYLLGEIYLSQKDKSKATEYFVKSMESNSWDLPYITLGNVYASDKQYEKAIDVYKKGINLVENKISLLMPMASVYEHQKNYDSAISIYEEILATNPVHHIAANNLASLLVDFKGDEVSIKKALDLIKTFSESDQPAFKDTVAWVYLKNNDAPKAITILEDVISKAPKVAIFQYHLGMAYYQSGDTANAKRYLTMAVGSDESYPGKEIAKETLSTL